jgi:bifunctional DNA-binding transcriptional regulator/antitoxin component of YhaV-PrlF toxin-antitoxin module
MTRIAFYKLARKGNRGYCLTVPPAWIRKHDLKPGAAIDVYETDDGDLVFRPAKP